MKITREIGDRTGEALGQFNLVAQDHRDLVSIDASDVADLKYDLAPVPHIMRIGALNNPLKWRISMTSSGAQQLANIRKMA
jgi:hypothetical protein